jgi:hypothetical protein
MGEEFANAMDFARLWAPCQLRFQGFLERKPALNLAVNSWWNGSGSMVAMYGNVDVHLSRTEIV